MTYDLIDCFTGRVKKTVDISWMSSGEGAQYLEDTYGSNVEIDYRWTEDVARIFVGTRMVAKIVRTPEGADDHRCKVCKARTAFRRTALVCSNGHVVGGF